MSTTKTTLEYQKWICIAMLGLLLVGVQTGCNLGVQHHNILGKQAYDSGQFAGAINEFQQAINLNPQNPDAYYNLGSTFYSMGKQAKNPQWLKQSEGLYRQAISLNDRHVDAHRGLAATLIETGQEKFAFDLLSTWQTRYPNSPEPTIELARLYQEYGDNRRATDLLADALRLDNQNVRALKAMGHIREVQGQTHLALDNYIRVLQIDNREQDVAQRVASLQHQLASLPVDSNQRAQGISAPSRYGSIAPYQPR